MNTVFKHTIEVSNRQRKKSNQQIANYKETLCSEQNLNFKMKGKQLNFSIIFSTSKGIFVLDTVNNIHKQLLKGKFYGITKHKEYWYFARLGTNGNREFPINERISEIYYSKISNGELVDLKIALFGIPSELHQIDSIKGNLTFPHTGYNQILSIPFCEIHKSNKPLRIENCKSIELKLNYHSHLNSIFANKNKLYSIAHNFTMRTGKMSDLIIYDLETEKHDVVCLNAHSAHNIYINSMDEQIYCDSNNKKLVKNNKVIYEADKLLRGLLVTPTFVFVGGSDICFENDKRYSNTPSIYLLNNKGELLTEYTFERLGDIYEIRALDI